MNDLLRNLTPTLMLTLPGLKLYAVCAIILVLKMQVVGTLTGFVRARRHGALNQEDVKGPGTVGTIEHPDVARYLRAHRNDLENIPSFLILGLLAVLLGTSPTITQVCFVVFTVARVGHSVAYLNAVQPWRSLSYILGLGSALLLMALIVARILA